MKMRKYISLLLITFSVALLSCEKVLEPMIDGKSINEEQLLRDPSLLEGLLI